MGQASTAPLAGAFSFADSGGIVAVDPLMHSAKTEGQAFGPTPVEPQQAREFLALMKDPHVSRLGVLDVRRTSNRW